MTENKRFTYEYDEYSGNLFDNKMHTFYHIEDSDENIEVLCDRLNWLVEENEELQVRNNAYLQDIEVYREENTCLKLENDQLKSENERLTNKLNEIALDFVNHYLVSMGKAAEISEMSYFDFLKFRKERGKPMELQE